MNMLEQETLRIASERGRPLPRALRGLLWATLSLFLVSILAFLAARELFEIRYYIPGG